MTVKRIGAPASVRDTVRFLASNRDLAERFEGVRKHIRIMARASYFEITSRCNLRCEGCFYFDGGYHLNREEDDIEKWRARFADEYARGTRFVYLVGAEPALEQDRLFAANEYFRSGLVGTNGTVRIDPAITFKLHLSVWGDPETDTLLRGAPAFEKALRNYRGEDRVLVLFTLSPQNLHQANDVVRRCHEHGLKLTFNMFSPTQAYLDRLNGCATPGSDPFFTVSTPENNLLWSDDTLAAKHRIVDELLDRYPETLVYSRSYNNWVTRPGPLFDIEPDGTARYCASRTGDSLTIFNTNLEVAPVKCCTSEISCSHCRMYSGGLASRLRPSVADLASREVFAEYLDICSHLMGTYVYEPDWAIQSVAE